MRSRVLIERPPNQVFIVHRSSNNKQIVDGADSRVAACGQVGQLLNYWLGENRRRRRA